MDEKDSTFDFLATKRYPPPLRPGFVSRPRLLARLAAADDRPLRLVSAPAGFGKSTLLAEWCQTDASRQFAWLTLDESDSDPTRFWYQVVTSLQALVPQLGHAFLDLLQAPRQPQMRSALVGFINDVADRPETRLCLILDDLHLVESPEIFEQLAFLVTHLPPQLQLAIGTRVDPSLPLARLRGRGQLLELRAADLRFQTNEVAAFLNNAIDMPLAPTTVSQLEQRTEGWIAGLHLAALSLRDHPETDQAVAALTGDHRYVLDYLLDEVLSRQTAATQTFLLHTAILDQLSSALCAAVTGREDSQAQLAALERANLFLIPLDPGHTWFRFHRLFRDLIHQRLLQTEPDLIPELHCRAAAWAIQAGQLDMAIKHSLAAGDADQAADLVAEAAEKTLQRSEATTLLRWLEALPENLIKQRPQLAVWQAGALLIGGRGIDLARARLQMATEHPDAALVAGELALFQALIAVFAGDGPAIARTANDALENLRADRTFLRQLASHLLAIAHVYNDDFAAAQTQFAQTASQGEQTGNIMVAVGALCNNAGLNILRCQLPQAAAIYQQALTLARRPDGRYLPIASKALVGLGRIHREWGRPAEAAAYLEEAIPLARQVGDMGAIVGLLLLALTRQTLGESAAAQTLLVEAKRLALLVDASDMDDMLVEITRVRLALAQNNRPALRQWLAAQPRPTTANAQLKARMNEIIAVTACRVHLHLGDPATALAIQAPLTPAFQTRGELERVLELRLIEAAAQAQLGAIPAALTALQAALHLAQAGGYRQTFYELAPALAPLLQRLPNEPYARELLADLPANSAPTAAAPATDILSEREIEVLRHISQGRSNRQIAADLVISLSTVKGHTSNIYSKLGVSRRTEAVARAQELGLL